MFSNLTIQYPIINKTLLKAILKNIWAPINIFKLSIDYTLDRKKIKVLKVNNTLTVNALEEDIFVFEVKD